MYECLHFCQSLSPDPHLGRHSKGELTNFSCSFKVQLKKKKTFLELWTFWANRLVSWESFAKIINNYSLAEGKLSTHALCPQKQTRQHREILWLPAFYEHPGAAGLRGGPRESVEGQTGAKIKNSVFVCEGLAQDDKIRRCFRHRRKQTATSFFPQE